MKKTDTKKTKISKNPTQFFVYILIFVRLLKIFVHHFTIYLTQSIGVNGVVLYSLRTPYTLRETYSSLPFQGRLGRVFLLFQQRKHDGGIAAA